MGQVAVGREQEQSFGVDVQSSDGNDPGKAQIVHSFKNGSAALRVLVARDFAAGLVVDPQFRHRLMGHGGAVDTDLVALLDERHGGDNGFSVEGHPAGLDPPFGISS